MLGALFATPRRSVRLGLATAAVLFALVLARLDGSRSPVRPIFSPDDVQDIDARTARAAGAHTPADAVFLVPPGFSVLRIIGQRAVVVDFEATPFQDRYMREWRERIRDVYGDVDGVGFVARAQLDDAYRHVTDGRLEQLAHQYQATHAILYAETATSLPEIYANDTYRIVRLPSP
jgi:hypothetical protein